MSRKPTIRQDLIGLCLAALLTVAVSCTTTTTPKLKVVTTTSLLGSITERLGKDRVSVTVITAPASHLGEEVKPSQVQAISEATLLLKHGWPGEAFSEGLVEAANNSELKVTTVQLEGNWMTPPVQAQGVEGVAEALSQVDPNGSDYYQANAQSLLEAIQSKGRELEARLQGAKTSEVNAISAGFQAGFVEWAGFNLIGTYGQAADLAPQEVQELVAKGKKAGVALVIDNLQSGPEAGVQMAQEMGAIQVTLSNFPGAFEGTDTWEEAIERNVELLLEALARHRNG